MIYTIIILGLAVAFVAVLSNFWDKKTKVDVPKGVTHIVQKPNGKINFFSSPVRFYRLGKYDKVVQLPLVRDMCFNFEIKDIFANVYWTAASLTPIKFDVRVACRINDVKKLFDLVNTFPTIIHSMVRESCLQVPLKKLLQEGIGEVITKDAILEKKWLFDDMGITVDNFVITNIRDAYGKEIVKNMRTKIAGETPKKSKYPSLEEVIAPEVDKL